MLQIIYHNLGNAQWTVRRILPLRIKEAFYTPIESDIAHSRGIKLLRFEYISITMFSKALQKLSEL